MRDIKFRARSVITMEWIYGETLIRAGALCYLMRDQGTQAFEHILTCKHRLQFILEPCDVKTLGQFTGVLDKNGREIYEGDLVKTRYSKKGPVKYNECNFHVEFGGYLALVTGEFEVVGNIHDEKLKNEKEKRKN